MTKETYYEVVKVTKRSDGVLEEEVVFITPQRSEALVMKDRLNADLSAEDRLMQEFRFALRSLLGGGGQVN